ncbi:MAG: hypothetical protein AAF686_08760, partial [Pseudomonadota bacterium]
LVDLQQGGYVNDLLFGGSGDVTLETFGARSIFATLIPETTFLFNAKAGGGSLSGVQLVNGDVAFLTKSDPAVIPLPAAGWLYLALIAGGVQQVLRRRRLS